MPVLEPNEGKKSEYLCITFPLAPFSPKTLSSISHKCFPHFPKSSECRVSYEYALYGSENRNSQRKCYMRD